MTANRIYYAVILAVSVSSAIFFPNKVTGALFYAAVILPVASFLLELFAFLSVQARQTINRSTLYKNDTVRVNFVARCSFVLSFAFIDLRIMRASIEKSRLRRADAFLCAAFGGRTGIGFDIACPYRGVYYIGADCIRMYDLLGLFCLKKKIEPCKVTVYPRVFPVVGLKVDNRLVGQTSITKNSLKKDDLLISHVRKYQQNDRPKAIHWKMTSKMNEIMVKEYEPLKEVGVIIVIDLQHKEAERRVRIGSEDKIIECALSLCAACLGDMLTVRIVYMNGSLADHHIDEIQDYQPLYNLLACIRFDGTTDIADTVRTIISERTGGANLMVVTDRSDDNLQNAFRDAVTAGYKTTLVRVVPEGDGDDWRGQIQKFAADGAATAVVNADEAKPIII